MGPYHAAVARGALHCVRPVGLVVDHNDIQAGPPGTLISIGQRSAQSSSSAHAPRT